MRECDSRTRWKFVTDPTSVTFNFLDINGDPIYVGDEIEYTRRVKGSFDYHRLWTPGYSQDAKVEVVALKCILSRSYYSNRLIVMKSALVRDNKTKERFSIYRTDKTFNITGAARRKLVEQDLKTDAIEELFIDPQIKDIVLSDSKNNDDAFNFGII